MKGKMKKLICKNCKHEETLEDNLFMVGRVGYAPTTPAMSMQYSTIELQSPWNFNFLESFLAAWICLGVLIF